MYTLNTYSYNYMKWYLQLVVAYLSANEPCQAKVLICNFQVAGHKFWGGSGSLKACTGRALYLITTV